MKEKIMVWSTDVYYRAIWLTSNVLHKVGCALTTAGNKLGSKYLKDKYGIE